MGSIIDTPSAVAGWLCERFVQWPRARCIEIIVVHFRRRAVVEKLGNFEHTAGAVAARSLFGLPGDLVAFNVEGPFPEVGIEGAVDWV